MDISLPRRTMKGSIHFIPLALIICVLVDFVMLQSSDQLLDDVTERVNKFALALFVNLLRHNPQGNVLVSPMSAELALAEAYLGAGGNTAKQMSHVLNLSENWDEFLNGHRQLMQMLQTPELKMANKLYLDKTLKVKKEFQDPATNYFLSSVNKVNFRGDYENARKAINMWVEMQTDKKIKDLLPESSVDQLTRLVIVNAMHFKCFWWRKFARIETKKSVFHITPTETKDVEMMSLTDYFKYRHDPAKGIKMLELPFENRDFRMVLVLPDAKVGLESIIPQIKINYNIAEKQLKLEETKVRVLIPKFKIEQDIEMNDLLKEMGMTDLFDVSRANLTGLSDNEQLHVNKVTQKAFIEVNEEGTEAGAATGIRLQYLSDIPIGGTFIADHPFVFAILHKNIILFVGTLRNV